jgi:hypothetical protein
MCPGWLALRRARPAGWRWRAAVKGARHDRVTTPSRRVTHAEWWPNDARGAGPQQQWQAGLGGAGAGAGAEVLEPVATHHHRSLVRAVAAVVPSQLLTFAEYVEQECKGSSLGQPEL